MNTEIKFVKLTGSFHNVLTNRTSVNSYAVMNSEGKFGYLPNKNKVYTPIGGSRAEHVIRDYKSKKLAFDYASLYNKTSSIKTVIPINYA